MANIEIHDPKFDKPICYYMNDGLKKSLDEKVVPDINKKDKDVVLVVDGGEGCFSGETIIRTNRASIGRKHTIKWMYNQFHGNPDKLKISNKWRLDIPTYVRSFDGNRIRLHQIRDVVYSGKKIVYKLILGNGRSIKVTSEHEVMTNEGMIKLNCLDKNKHKVMCDSPNTKANKNFKHKFHDIQIGGLIYHPLKKRIEIHRIIYEANLNKLELSKFIEILSTDSIKSNCLKFLEPFSVIHHKDFNHYNNNIDNLECLSIEEHLKLHSEYNYLNFNQGVPEYSNISSIELIGEEDTYDIKCCVPYHNFSANDIIMSNSGKSTLTFQLAKYIDPSFNLSRVVFNADAFKEAVFRAKKGQCIVYDEAFTGLSSRASLSGINRYLVSLMMQMRQKNLCVFVVLPTFFLLDKYVALFRTKALIHVYETGGRRGYFKVYSRKLKKYLFLQGRPTYSYLPKKIKTKKKGRFYGVFALGFEKEEEKYRKAKSDALEATEKNPMSGQQVKYMEQRNLLLYILRKTTKMKYRELHNLLEGYDFGMHYTQIADICKKFGDYTDETIEKEAKNDEKGLNEPKSDVKVVLGQKRGRGHVKSTERVLKKSPIKPKEAKNDESQDNMAQIDEIEPIIEDLDDLGQENDEF